MKLISIIVPTLNEEEYLASCLKPLQEFRNSAFEIIVVDGGSRDRTVAVAEALADAVLSAGRGRAVQMNAGAQAASGDILLFLHADTILPENVGVLLNQAVQSDLSWGRFDIMLSGRNPLFRMIEFFMNLRSRLTGIATGDQGIFVTKALYDRSGGIPVIALMEDIVFSAGLRQLVSPVCLRDKVLSSSRRWEQHGIIKTILKMWYLRFRYAFGADPVTLTKQYDS